MKKYIIDNDRFLEVLKEYNETKVISNELGEMFIDISKIIMKNNSFKDYTSDWKYSMIHEAMLNCCRYADRFDVDKHTSPFSYFFQVVRNSFLQAIAREKRIHKQDIEIKTITRVRRDVLISSYTNAKRKPTTGLDYYDTRTDEDGNYELKYGTFYYNTFYA